MLGCDCFLGFALGDVVGFRGYEGDEFDAAVYEEVAGVFAEGDGLVGGGGVEDFIDYLLDGGCIVLA